MKKNLCLMLLVFISFSLFAETSFCFEDFKVKEAFYETTEKIQNNFNSQINRIDEHFFETDYLVENNYRKKYIFGFNNSLLNLVIEYILVESEEELLILKNEFRNHIESNASYKWDYTTDYESWINGIERIRYFSNKYQMDGKDGYTFWILYSGNSVGGSAYDYIYNPYRLHKKPVVFDDIIVHWDFDMDIYEFKKKYPTTLFSGQSELRDIIKVSDTENIYVNYSFNKEKLERIHIRYEFANLKKERKKYASLKQLYIDEYGDGSEEPTYDKDLYGGYRLSKTQLICDSIIMISYYTNNYVLDQINKDYYLVTITFIKF